MRNLIVGGIAIAWGLLILIYALFSGVGGNPGDLTAFGVGQVVGMAFGALLLVGGGTYFVWQLMAMERQRSYRAEPRRRPGPERTSKSPIVTLAIIGVLLVVVLGFVGVGVLAVVRIYFRPAVEMPFGRGGQQANDPTDVKGLVADLGSDPVRARVARDALIALGPSIEPEMIRLLSDPDRRVRAAQILERVGTAASLEPLERAKAPDELPTNSFDKAIEAIKQRERERSGKQP